MQLRVGGLRPEDARAEELADGQKPDRAASGGVDLSRRHGAQGLGQDVEIAHGRFLINQGVSATIRPNRIMAARFRTMPLTDGCWCPIGGRQRHDDKAHDDEDADAEEGAEAHRLARQGREPQAGEAIDGGDDQRHAPLQAKAEQHRPGAFMERGPFVWRRGHGDTRADCA